MLSPFRRFPLAAMVVVLTTWLPVGAAQADPVPEHTRPRADNPCGTTVVRTEPVATAVPEQLWPADVSSLLTHELGQALFHGHRR